MHVPIVRSVLTRLFLSVLAAVAVTGCSSNFDFATVDVPDVDSTPRIEPLPATGLCADPAPSEVRTETLVSPIASDLDPTAGGITPTAQITFSVLLPERCPGDRFAVVMQSHGYGGSRQTGIAASGDPDRSLPNFPSFDALTRALPRRGYIVVSIDQRGHGDSSRDNGGANARIIDPLAETQDAIQILDWLVDHADALGVATQPETGIPDDLRVATLGFSYGGGFQMPLAALDARIDALIPNGTWHNLVYSLLPGDTVKQSFDGLLCLLGQQGGVTNTPVVATLCNLLGVQSLNATQIRTRPDLVQAASEGAAIPANPRPVAEAEFIDFFFTHGMNYFRNRERAGQPWGFGETEAVLRPVPALFIQGNRDVIFNLTEAYWNWQYFRDAGGDVRLLSNEGAHMNPLANQVEGTAHCGSVSGVDAAIQWLNVHLQGASPLNLGGIPPVCISVADTDTAHTATRRAVALDDFPVGQQSGPGSVNASLNDFTVTVRSIDPDPQFVPVATIDRGGLVIAGAPRIAQLNVTRNPSLNNNVGRALVGVGIRRDGALILVDDQVTGFVEGNHTANREIGNDAILLPAVGEMLQPGDEVGLIFFERQIQYAAILSPQSVGGATGLIGFIGGQELPPLTSELDPLLGLLTAPNPYTVTGLEVSLPIFEPGVLAGSGWR